MFGIHKHLTEENLRRAYALREQERAIATAKQALREAQGAVESAEAEYKEAIEKVLGHDRFATSHVSCMNELISTCVYDQTKRNPFHNRCIFCGSIEEDIF
jgi:multidrug resistance efflux pump